MEAADAHVADRRYVEVTQLLHITDIDKPRIRHFLLASHLESHCTFQVACKTFLNVFFHRFVENLCRNSFGQ